MCATSQKAGRVEAELETIWIVFCLGVRVGTIVDKDYSNAFTNACRLLGKDPDHISLEDSGQKKPKCPNCSKAR